MSFWNFKGNRWVLANVNSEGTQNINLCLSFGRSVGGRAGTTIIDVTILYRVGNSK